MYINLYSLLPLQPDLYGRDNCVYHNGYYDFMTGAVRLLWSCLSCAHLISCECKHLTFLTLSTYHAVLVFSLVSLFNTREMLSNVVSCKTWLPWSERADREWYKFQAIYPVKGYFYPSQDNSNCIFGRNYPLYVYCFSKTLYMPSNVYFSSLWNNTYYIFSFRWMAQAQYSQDYLYTTGILQFWLGQAT